MRKWAAWIIALVMAFAAGCAFGETKADLYDLYDNTENGRTWAGNAVPVLPGVAVMSPAGMHGEPSALEIWNGADYTPVTYAVPAANEKLLVLISDPEGEETGIPEYELADPAGTMLAEDLIVRWGDWMGSRINRAVYSAASIPWQDMDCMILTLSGTAEPGSPVLTKDGKLAGIIAAEYAEGENRYIALTAAEIMNALIEASGQLTGGDTRPEGYEVTIDRSTVTFDWSEVELPEIPEGKALFHVVADVDSDYLNYLEVGRWDTRTQEILTPGRTYISGLMICDRGGAPDDWPEQIAWTTLPEAKPLTEHSFRSEIFAIGELAEDAPEDTMPVPAEEITEELLRSGRACIYSATSYDVDRTLDSLSLLVALTSPAGSNYRWESAWVYGPEYEEWDEWYVRIPETGLLEILNDSGYPEGVYEMSMYINGELADSFTFTLKK